VTFQIEISHLLDIDWPINVKFQLTKVSNGFYKWEYSIWSLKELWSSYWVMKEKLESGNDCCFCVAVNQNSITIES